MAPGSVGEGVATAADDLDGVFELLEELEAAVAAVAALVGVDFVDSVEISKIMTESTVLLSMVALVVEARAKPWAMAEAALLRSMLFDYVFGCGV